MSHGKGIRERLVGDSVDLTLAKVGVVVSILLLGLRLVASQVFLLTIPLAVGTGCLLYVVARNRSVDALALPTVPRWVSGYLPSVVIVGLAALLLVIWSAGERTVLAYLLTGAVGAAILAQILVDSNRVGTGAILLQILVAAVVIRLGALYVTPGYVGVDIWTHVPVFVEGILQEGSLSAIGGSKYVMAPFYHAIGAVGAVVVGDARSGVYLVVGLLVTLSTLFVYANASLFVSSRWALLATALFAFADQIIRWGMHVIPTSLGLAFFLGALYCVSKVFFTDADRWAVGLLAVFSLAIVFTHQVSTAIVLVLLGIAAAVAVGRDLLVPGPRGRRLTRSAAALSAVFVGTLAVTVWSWANTPFTGGRAFLWNRFEVIAAALGGAGFLDLAGGTSGGEAATAGEGSLGAIVAPYVDVFGFALLLAAAVIGGLVMLSWEDRADVSLTHVLTAGVAFVAVFGLSLFGVRVLLPGRWLAFMYAPMVVIGAIGLGYLARNGPRRVILACVLVLAIGYPTTMVVAEKATLDSPAFDEQYPRFSYNEAEIAGLETVRTIHPPSIDRALHTDHPYRTVFVDPGGFEARVLVMEDGQADSSSPVVYREYQSTGPVTFHRPGEVPREGFSANFDADDVCRSWRDHVYANDDVRFCTPSPIGQGVMG